jgi:hypothetical protein
MRNFFQTRQWLFLLCLGALSACGALLKRPPLAPGHYSAETKKYVGFVSLEARKDGSATFLNVVSAHLPPVELERAEVKLTKQAGKICLSPAPKTIEPCLTLKTKTQLEATVKEDGSTLLLQLQKK